MENTQFEIETLFKSSVPRDDLELKSLQTDFTGDESYWSECSVIGGFSEGHLQSTTGLIKAAGESFIWTASQQKNEAFLRENVTEGDENVVPAASEDLSTVVRGTDVGDAPTEYSVRGLRNGELPVIGTYVDPRIIPGFQYKVRLIGSKRFMFEGRALTLLSIGKGYGKRITFQGDSLNDNDNYFWSDSNPEGCAFSLVALEQEESFSIYDEHSRPVGTAVMSAVDCNQFEVSTQICNGAIEKRVGVTFTCEVHFGGTRHGVMPVYTDSVIQTSGVALLIKEKRCKKAILKSIKCIDVPFHGQCVFYKDE